MIYLFPGNPTIATCNLYNEKPVLDKLTIPPLPTFTEYSKYQSFTSCILYVIIYTVLVLLIFWVDKYVYANH